MNRGKLPTKALTLLSCGLCLGFFAALVLFPSESESGTEDLRSNIQELNRVVSRLDTTLVRFGEASQAPPAMNNPTVLRSSIQDDSIDELIRHLEKVEKALPSISAGAALESIPQDYPPMKSSGDYPLNVQALLDLKTLSEVDVSLGHLNWTYDQILKKFGSPTLIDDGYDNGAVGFVYSDLPGGGRVWIDFSRGRVATLSTKWSE